MKKPTRQAVTSAIVLLVMLAAIVWLCVRLAPLLVQVFRHAGDESQMTSYIDAYGAEAIPVLIGLAALQVVFFSIIPAACIQLLAGLCYGMWLGGLISLTGLVLGNAVVFLAVRRFGSALGPLLHREEKPGKKNRLLSVETLRRLPKPERAAFLLYLIPGLPDGFLPYLFAETTISFPRYLLAVALASTPAMLLFTLSGERLATGHTAASLVLLGVFLLVVLLFVVFRKRVVRWLTRSVDRQEHPLE